MKAKKIFLAILVLGFALVLASCGEQHTHTFDDEWSKDPTHHWHAATCEHTTEVNGKAEHSWDLGTITKQPTEEAAGEKTYKCSVCEATKVEPVDQLAHTHKYSTEWSKDENTHWHASTCGHDVKGDEAEHDWDAGVEQTPATEDEFGEMLHTCTVCGQTKVEQIDKLPHTHKYEQTYTYDEFGHWYASACGHEDEVDGYADHDYDEGTVTTLPTCIANGEKTFTCACGYSYTEPVAKDANNHLFAEGWSKNETHHWHASTCGHDVKSGEAEHGWDEGQVTTDPTYYQEGVKTYTCTTCGQTKTESVPVLKNYEDSNWTSKIENGYYYLDGKVYSAVKQDLNPSGDSDLPWFYHDAEAFTVYNTQQGAHYTISVDVKGLVSSLEHDTLFMGVVVWYQDADNYVVFGSHWAKNERPGDIRSFSFKGRIDGQDYFPPFDVWCDGSLLLPADGLTLEITKLRDTFSFVVKKSNGTTLKSGQYRVPGTDTANSYVGLMGVNDTFEFSNFTVEAYAPAPTVYTATVGNVEHRLELSKLDDTFVLKVGSEESRGTYVVEGYNITLTFEDESVKVATFSNDGTFVYAEAEDEEGVIKVADGAVVEVAANQTGDYEWSFHVDGNATSIGAELYYRFFIWYVDASNNAEVRIFWNHDRSYEMNKLQLWVNGSEATNHWGDNPHNNTLPADGFDVKVVKNAGVFAVTIKAKTATYNFNYSPSNYNADATYSVCAGAANDSYKLKDVVFTEIEAAKYQTYTNNTDESIKLDLSTTNNECKLTTSDGEQTGTYVKEGAFAYLTLGDETLKVRLLDNKFLFVQDDSSSEFIEVKPGELTTFTSYYYGDYQISMDVVGETAEAVTAFRTKFRFYAWYLDENNYVVVSIEWWNGDRPYEIRAIGVEAVLNGQRAGYSERFGDWDGHNNTLPADGFKLTITKTGKAFAVVTYCPVSNMTYTNDVLTVSGLDTNVGYLLGATAETDTFKVSNHNIPTSMTVAPAENTTFAINCTGDYQISMDVVGETAETVTAFRTKFRFYAWYLDENNYVVVSIEWWDGDRPYEIRAIGVEAVLNGQREGYSERFGDWDGHNNTLPADGFKLTITKTGKAFAVVTYCPVSNMTYTNDVLTVSGLDTAASYELGATAETDTFTVTNVKFQ